MTVARSGALALTVAVGAVGPAATAQPARQASTDTPAPASPATPAATERQAGSGSAPTATAAASASTPIGDRPAASEAREVDLRDVPHTTFGLGLGLLALPGAAVCPTPQTCEPGEVSIGLVVQNLYHFSGFALGAGIDWAWGLRSEAAAGDPSGELSREHSRSYFVIDGLFRYYPVRFADDWEVWVGANAGVVIIRDSWSTVADREPYSESAMVGPRSPTMGTEGFEFGAGVGLQWSFVESGVFGSYFRYSNWLLPEERETAPTGDQASLAGRIDVLDFGLTVAYRLAL